MKVLAVVRKNLLELAREPMLLGLVLVTPLAFLLVNYAGYSQPFLHTHKVQVINRAPAGEEALAYLKNQRYSDGLPIFEFTSVADSIAAEQALYDRSTEALLILESATDNKPFSVTIRGDALSMEFLEAGPLLESKLAEFADTLAKTTLPVDIMEKPILSSFSGPQTYFLVLAPGLLIFAILLLIPQTAMLLGREIRTGTIRRLQLTDIRPLELLGGITIAQMVVALVQVGLFLSVYGFWDSISVIRSWQVSSWPWCYPFHRSASDCSWVVSSTMTARQ